MECYICDCNDPNENHKWYTIVPGFWFEPKFEHCLEPHYREVYTKLEDAQKACKSVGHQEYIAVEVKSKSVVTNNKIDKARAAGYSEEQIQSWIC